MKILLVVPRFVASARQLYEYPIGLAYISAALKQAGHDVLCQNLNLDNTPPADAVAAAVRRWRPDVCATGAISPVHGVVKVILDAAREADPGIVNVVGGGIFGSDPEMAARALDADIGVIGEGESTAVELMAALDAGTDLGTVDGIAFRADGRLVTTAARAPIRDLGTLPWPDYDGLGLDHLVTTFSDRDNNFFATGRPPRTVAMITSRSCPFLCSFCFHPTGRVFRERPLDDVFAELEHYIERHGITAVRFMDELFAMDKRRVLEFSKRIKDYGLQWFVSLHASIVDEDFGDVLDTMRDAGCVYIGWGVESINPTVLKSMDKKVTRPELATALAETHAHRVGILGNFIFGDAAETIETANDTMDWWSRHRQYQIALSQLRLYPGSPLYVREKAAGRVAIQDGIYFDDPSRNLTAIPNGRFQAMLHRIGIFRESLTLPAGVLAFERNPEPDPDRGEHYRVEWRCPTCGTVNRECRVFFDWPHEFQHSLLTCSGCRSLVHVPRMIRRTWDAPELDQRYAEARVHRDAGHIEDAEATYRSLTELEFPAHVVDRPPPVVRAFFDLGMIAMEARGDIATAVRNLGPAVYWNAFDPVFHLAFASALLGEGSHSAARLHAEQARTLAGPDTAGIEAMAQPMVAMAEEREKAEGPRYFQ